MTHATIARLILVEIILLLVILSLYRLNLFRVLYTQPNQVPFSGNFFVLAYRKLWISPLLRLRWIRRPRSWIWTESIWIWGILWSWWIWRLSIRIQRISIFIQRLRFIPRLLWRLQLLPLKTVPYLITNKQFYIFHRLLQVNTKHHL